MIEDEGRNTPIDMSTAPRPRASICSCGGDEASGNSPDIVDQLRTARECGVAACTTLSTHDDPHCDALTRWGTIYSWYGSSPFSSLCGRSFFRCLYASAVWPGIRVMWATPAIARMSLPVPRTRAR